MKSFASSRFDEFERPIRSFQPSIGFSFLFEATTDTTTAVRDKLLLALPRNACFCLVSLTYRSSTRRSVSVILVHSKKTPSLRQLYVPISKNRLNPESHE